MMKATKRKDANKEFSDTVGRALRRSAKAARRTAKIYGTPLYFWKIGTVVAEKP